MTPQELQTELKARHLQVLAVGSGHVAEQPVAIIYLHAGAGQYADGHALHVVRSVPEVKKAAASQQTPTMILAWLE